MLNANHYLRPGDLLARDLTGFRASAFPARLIVDEQLNGGHGNRQGISNGGNPKGNYSAATGGWQRHNIGVGNKGWTGFDVLHQGQAAGNRVTFSSAALEVGLVQFDVALLIRYCEPKGVPLAGNPEARMPQAPPDPVIFAYRLPHGALDGGDIRFPDHLNRHLILGGDAGATAAMAIAVRDWDALAIGTIEPVLADDPALDHVTRGASGTPAVTISVPVLQTEPFTATYQSGTGAPGAELRYGVTITSPSGAILAGEHFAALVQVADPEQAAPDRLEYHFGLDPATLIPDASRALECRTWQALACTILPPMVSGLTGWQQWGGTNQSGIVTVTHRGLAVDALGNALVTGAYQGTIDFDPGPGEAFQTSPPGGQHRFALALDPQGHYKWAGTWNGQVLSLLPAFFSDGRVLLAGQFWSSQLDFDPGPGEYLRNRSGGDAFLLELAPEDGQFVRVLQLGDGGSASGISFAQVLADEAGNFYFTGSFHDEIGSTDYNPGPGFAVTQRALLSGSYFLAVDPALNYRFHGNFGDGFTYPEDFPAHTIAIAPDGRLLIAGSFKGTQNFYTGVPLGEQRRTSLGNHDAYLLITTPAGGYSDVLTWGGPQQVEAREVVCRASDGRMYIAGSFRGLADLDPGPAVMEFEAQGQTLAYLLALDSSGSYEWATTWGSGIVATRRLVLDPVGNLLLSGSAAGSFLTVLDAADGSLRSVLNWFAATVGQGAVALNPDGALMLACSFAGALDIDPGPASMVRSPQGQQDGLLLRLVPLDP